MCIRYSIEEQGFVKWTHDMRTWGNIGDWLEFGDRFPGSFGPIVVPSADGLMVERANWGLQPWWATKPVPKPKKGEPAPTGKKPKGDPDPTWGRNHAYNARSETVFEKPTFRGAIKARRCIVPAAKIFERANGRWLAVQPLHEPLFAVAGLYEPPNSLAEVQTYTLVTTEPNAIFGEIHDRMPVILTGDQIAAWLDPATSPDELVTLMTPCPDEWLRIEDAGPVVRAKRKKEDPESLP